MRYKLIQRRVKYLHDFKIFPAILGNSSLLKLVFWVGFVGNATLTRYFFKKYIIDKTLNFIAKIFLKVYTALVNLIACSNIVQFCCIRVRVYLKFYIPTPPFFQLLKCSPVKNWFFNWIKTWNNFFFHFKVFFP